MSPVGFGDEDAERRAGADIVAAVRKALRPELVARLDAVVPFRRLDLADIERIVDLEIEKASKREGLATRRLRLVVDDAARAQLARAGFDPTYGARPLRRVIEERVMTPVAVRIAAQPALVDRTIHVVGSASALAALTEADRSLAVALT